VVGLAPELPLGQVALAEPAVLDRMGTVDAAHLEGVGGELEEHLARERVVSRVQRVELGHQVVHLSAGSHPPQHDLESGDAILVRRSR